MKNFRLIIAGTRTFTDYSAVEAACDVILLSILHDDVEIVSGACDTGIITFTRNNKTKVYGADGLGERYADENKLPVKLFPADWDKHGKKAGPMRNLNMAQYATNALIFWDGFSRGAEDMILKAKKYLTPLKTTVVLYASGYPISCAN
jgi:hypothetical protein